MKTEAQLQAEDDLRRCAGCGLSVKTQHRGSYVAAYLCTAAVLWAKREGHTNATSPYVMSREQLDSIVAANELKEQQCLKP